MKWSRYNVMFKKSKGDGYLLYNTMSGAFLELCNEDASVLEKIRDGKFLATELEPKALRFLTENGVFVESDDVELAKFKLLKQYNRMDDSYMALTIAPTLSCNLHCPYCFEKEHPNIFMTDEVENGIVDFIKGHKNVRRMKVSWFGGEPLCMLRLTTHQHVPSNATCDPGKIIVPQLLKIAGKSVIMTKLDCIH